MTDDDNRMRAYLDRATECLGVAERMRDPFECDELIKIARAYLRLAERQVPPNQ